MYSTAEIEAIARSGGCVFVWPREGREADRPVAGCLGHVTTWSARTAAGTVATFREREGAWHLESDTPRGHSFCAAVIGARLDCGISSMDDDE